MSGSEASLPDRLSRPFCCRVSRSTCSPSWNFVFSSCRFTVTNLGMPADMPAHHTTRALMLCLHALHIAILPAAEDLLAATKVRSGLRHASVITTAADVVSTMLLLQGVWVMTYCTLARYQGKGVPPAIPLNFGICRYRGVWPPSKPGRDAPPPARDFCPRMPKPQLPPCVHA